MINRVSVEPILAHSTGPWKKHEYVKKTQEDGYERYWYPDDISGPGSGSKTSKKDSGDSIGQYGKGNIDLYNRPQYRNEDGSISTVRSMSFQDDDGKETLIPTIGFDKNGNAVSWSDDEAIEQYYKTGKHLGKFDSVKEADEYAEKLHKQQEAYYKDKDGGSKGTGRIIRRKGSVSIQKKRAKDFNMSHSELAHSANHPAVLLEKGLKWYDDHFRKR